MREPGSPRSGTAMPVAPRVPDGPDRPYPDRKRRGAWYTPADLARRMVKRALAYVEGPARWAIDPFAGTGVFLAATAGHGLAACGVDVDPDALAAARSAVPTAHCVVGDALLAPHLGGVDWPAEFPEAMAVGGFDLVLGNPPWEVVERSVHAPHLGGAEYARKLRASGYRFQRAGSGGGGKLNLYRLAVERAFGLLRPGGVLAFLVPAGLLRDAGSAALRRHLLEEGAWLEVWELESGNDLFPTAHRDLPVAAIFVRRGGPTTALELPGGRLGLDTITRGDPLGLGIPALRRPGDAALLERLLAFPRLDAVVAGLGKGDVNLATDRALFRSQPTGLVLRTGKEIAPYRVVAPASRWVDPAAFGQRRDTSRLRVAWRDIADITLRKRMCAAPLPPGSVLGDTLDFLAPPYSADEAYYWLAVLNSHVFEWLVRLRSAHNHLGPGVVGPCRVPPFDPRGERCMAIARMARQAGKSAATALEVDAAVARLYGLNAGDMDVVMAAFPKQSAAFRDALIQAVAGVWL